jgi:hypothetical protein
MKRLLLCLALSAFTASLLHTFEWERTARRDWKQAAAALSQSDLAPLLRDGVAGRSLSSDR